MCDVWMVEPVSEFQDAGIYVFNIDGRVEPFRCYRDTVSGVAMGRDDDPLYRTITAAQFNASVIARVRGGVKPIDDVSANQMPSAILCG